MSADDLTKFIDTVCGESRLRVESDLGDGFVRLRSSEAERRQAAQDIRCTEDILIEMLRNSRDAHARTIFVAVSREGERRRLVIIDDGEGIPSSMHERIFEPRVTSKLDTAHMDKWGMHGRGMALYSVAQNAQTARVVRSGAELGSSIEVETNLAVLGEKTDQSTYPTLCQTDDRTFSLRGPKNIARIASEFALEHRHECTVYLGSPAEIAASLYAFGCSALSPFEQLFSLHEEEAPLCKRLALAADDDDFARIAATLGLALSARTAHRIMAGEVGGACNLLSRLEGEVAAFSANGGEDDAAKRPVFRKALAHDARGLKLERIDAETLACAAQAAFDDIAPRYYLQAGQAKVRVSKDAVHISIPIEKLR